MTEEEEPLSPMARLFQSPEVDYCIVTIMGFKTKICTDVLLDALDHNVSKHPRFCTKLTENGAKWIEAKINVQDHVVVPYIYPEEIGEDGQGFVDDYISRLTMIPLDRSRPLWDMHILNVKTSDAEAVGVIRSHHSLGDGMSLISLMLACTHRTLDPQNTDIHSLKRRETVLRGLRNQCWFLRLRFTVCSIATLLWNTLVDMLLLLATVLFLKDTKVAQIVGTINDVLVGVTQAALSSYLNRLYGNKKKEEDGALTSYPNHLPDRLRFRVGCVVNQRSDIGLQAAATLFNQPVKNATTCLSNVSGPMDEISFRGNPIAYIALSSYGHSQALLVHYISYAGKMIISLAVDPTIIPDPHKICDDMEESLESMKAALSAKESL
ncbi:hypothetical protein DY000_02000509 [Brassica cretica]|uniref:Diacylglycerol O-acyltransferase n=1 Tax=Brassica cretica TaxID=69181 RepID=A0ABQ7BUI4_BRACR|nr:hypothetical protein DY000_02000509 [Brassica cretica]